MIFKNNKNSNSEIALKIENISKSFRVPHRKIDSIKGAFVNIYKKNYYEKFEALRDISFEVKKGEFFGIIGRNGSGKSTLLKILAGVYQADSGKVQINGLVSPFLELGIGFNPELSGRDNVYLNAIVLGLTKKEIDKKFDEIVAFAELEEFIDQQLKNYSSGMSVRLAFSVSIHANREILLMDEVLAVGDSNFQSKCLSEFNRYKEMGKTVILVTHDIATVQRYCDRAMLLRNGKVKMIGKADKVANEYVYDNMSDEEKRLASSKNDTNKDTGSETKNKKIAEITGVKFLDKGGREKNVFETGESIDIKIDFNINKKVDILNFGLGIHSESNGQILGYNTQVDKYIFDKKNNYIILHFDSLPILKGSYFINVSCFRNVGEVCYDFKPKHKFIEILSKGIKNNYVGIIDINHNWI